MADENDEILELDTPIDDEADDAAETPDAPEAEEGEGEYSIEIDGEEPADEPDLVKHLRAEVRDRDRRLATYEKAPPKIEVGPMPTMEDADVDWIPEKLEEKMAAWLERRDAAAKQEADAARAAEAQNQQRQTNLIRYQSKLAAIPLPPEEKQRAQDAVVSALPELHQSVIVGYADDPAKVVLALAKHPAKMEALAAEPDILKVAKAVWEIERNLKVVTRKKPPAPESETVQRGTAALSGSADKKLAELEREADRSGDRSKLIAYRALNKAA